MIDLAAIQAEFSELQNIKLLSTTSGQKDVFQADRGTKQVALKLIKRTQSDQRTEREISAVSKLNSSYVPQIYEHGRRTVSGEERFYIIERFIVGESYGEVLRKTPVQPFKEVLRLADVLLHACVDFENVQLVHRDIKPQNLMVDADGKIWVIDFGIARHLEMTSLTPSGPFHGIGTLGYAPPEQFRNLKSEEDSRTDLFSIGVVLYQSISGSNPYLNLLPDTMAVIRLMETQDLPQLSIAEDQSGELSDFLSVLTARFPSRRPQTASEALAWFDPIYQRLR